MLSAFLSALTSAVPSVQYDPANEVLLQERVDLSNIQNYVVNKYVNVQPVAIALDRNLEGDTFNIIEYGGTYNGTRSRETSIDVDGETHIEESRETDNGSYKTFIHRSMFNMPKLRAVQCISVKSYIALPPTNRDGIADHLIVFPHFEKPIQNASLANGKFLHLKSIKEIIFMYHKYFGVRGVDPYSDFQTLPYIYLKYNDTYVVPVKQSQRVHNISQFNIYTQDSDDLYEYDSGEISDLPFTGTYNKDMQTEMDVDVSSYKSTSFGSTKQTLVNKKASQLPNSIKLPEFNGVPLFSQLQYVDNNYYDYDTQKVVNGMRYDSNWGELIPFSLKGNYLKTVDLKINSVFNKLRIGTSDRIEKPILSPYSGKVRIAISNNAKEIDTPNKLSKNVLLILKKEDLPLDGLLDLNYEE